MKILHYIPSIDRSSGGVGAYMQLLARELGKLVELHILTHASENELVIENADVHYMTSNWMPWGSAKLEFTSILEDIKPSVFHTNSCWLPLSAKTAMWAKKRGYKVVYTPHGMLEPWVIKKNYWKKKLPALLLFQKRALVISDILVATAKSEKDNLIKLGYNKKIYVLPNSVEVDKIELKQDWSIKRKIFFIALLRPNKGADLLIRAVERLKDVMKEYKVIIAGKGNEEYERELRLLVNQSGVEEIIELPGSIFGEEKWQLYRESDVFVLPTLNENFGIVIAESLSSGTPVITTKGAPWPELETEECGWWIDRDVDSLVQALKSFLCKTPEELKDMGLRGRKLVEEKYSSEKVAKQFLAMYERLISE